MTLISVLLCRVPGHTEPQKVRLGHQMREISMSVSFTKGIVNYQAGRRHLHCQSDAWVV